jgi:hypothetical protein
MTWSLGQFTSSIVSPWRGFAIDHTATLSEPRLLQEAGVLNLRLADSPKRSEYNGSKICHQYYLMPTALRLAPLLQIQLAEPIQDTLMAVQEAPLVTTVVTVCVLLGIVLLFLEMQSQRLSSMLSSWLQIRTQLNELGTAPTAADLDTQTDRAKLLKAFGIKLEKRLKDVLGTDQLIALSYEDRPAEVGRYQRPAPPATAPADDSPTWQTRLQSLNPMRLLRRPEQAPVALDRGGNHDGGV